MSESDWGAIVVEYIKRRLDGYRGCLLVNDPDGLLTSMIHAALVQEEWSVLAIAEDPLALRLAYEEFCRSTHPDSRQNRLFLLPANLPVPYDVEITLPLLSIGLADLFPGLDRSLLDDLSDEWYAALYAAHIGQPEASDLDWTETLRFLLRYGLDVPLPDQPTLGAYLHILARVVGSQRVLPGAVRNSLLSHFAPILGQHTPIPDLPSAERFLLEVWKAYQHSFVPGSALLEPSDPLVADAANSLHQEALVQTDFTQLREQGLLPAWRLENNTLLPVWLRQNLHFYIDPILFLAYELTTVADQIPTEADSLAEWMSFAQLWSRTRLTFYTLHSVDREVAQQFQQVHGVIEERFLTWLLANYPRLLQAPYLPTPQMVHHLLPYLATKGLVSTQSSLAVLVVDGMGLDDWAIIRDVWQQKNLTWHVENRTLLALVPSLTSVSRQALLSGRLPHHFADAWMDTSREGRFWSEFWIDQGLASKEILYLRHITFGEPADYSRLESTLAASQAKVGAFVINDVDAMVHRSQDASQFMAQIRVWEERSGVLQRTVAILLDYFDRVVVTSDHGHVEGQGIGDIPFGYVAEERAVRTRLFAHHQPQAMVTH